MTWHIESDDETEVHGAKADAVGYEGRQTVWIPTATKEDAQELADFLNERELIPCVGIKAHEER